MPATITTPSPRGKFRVAPHVFGMTAKVARPYVTALGGFGAVAGFAAIYLMEGVPRVQHDILAKIPILGSYWTGREIPASDNPF
ncbi:ubiquinol-cytochrome-c reductase complex subunit-domain-containing protein [Kalaharituber pfeilii]|nr:ubiquinol-cytochrome-c reductase complex subunit-domain-containing protein [Kalaharituber pfeilii]